MKITKKTRDGDTIAYKREIILFGHGGGKLRFQRANFPV